MLNKIYRHLSVTAGCILLLAGTMNAQTFTQVTADLRLQNGAITPNTTIYTSRDLTKKIGISYFGLITQGWAEAYAGPYVKINKKLTIGLALGLETPSPYWRFGYQTTYFTPKSSVLFFLEKGSGSDNYWYSLTATHQPKKIIYGLKVQRFYGIGPSIGYPIKKTKLTIAPLYDVEVKSFKPTIFFQWVL